MNNSQQEMDFDRLDKIERSHPDYEVIVTHLINEAMKPNPNPEYVTKDEINDWLKSIIDDSE